MSNVIVQFDRISKIYSMGGFTVEALKSISFTVTKGEFISIMGPSGCGKSTLLNLLGCLDKPSNGSYFLGGCDVSRMEDDALSAVRGQRLGFVFQSYNLIPQLTVVENIEIPLYYRNVEEDECRTRAIKLATLVGLEKRLNHKPSELSGGQQQRVAIARSLVNDPILLLADEPTGNLDSKSGKEILLLFDELHHAGKTLILITHDESVAYRSQRTLRLRDGEIESDINVKSISSTNSDRD